MKELVNIQQLLKAPKTQYNAFGKYRYRSAEDILEAVKPLYTAQGCHLTITDALVDIAGRLHIHTTALLVNGAGEQVATTAFATIDYDKKGMDAAQCVGAASSYARKYALNGLFAIDDTKDADATNTHGKEEAPAVPAAAPAAPATGITDNDYAEIETAIANCGDTQQLTAVYNRLKGAFRALLLPDGKFRDDRIQGALSRRKDELNGRK